MFEQFHKDYEWQEGIPLPKGGLEDPRKEEVSYRVLADSYRARISVEEYRFGVFQRIIYDSALLDFRKFKPEFQQAWESHRVEEGEDLVICHLRDDADRLVIVERHHFKGEKEVRCEWYYPMGGILLAVEEFGEGNVRVLDAAGREVISRDISE